MSEDLLRDDASDVIEDVILRIERRIERRQYAEERRLVESVCLAAGERIGVTVFPASRATRKVLLTRLLGPHDPFDGHWTPAELGGES